ncbi:MAG: DUF6524 family protein [Paracoccaceae bacterium]
MGFLSRWFFAFVLIGATFNPTPYNFVSWTRTRLGDDLPLTVFFGLLLVIGYVIYLRATLRSIGAFGIILVFSVFAALIWVLWDRDLLSLNNSDANVWMGILALSLVLGIGLSWSSVRRMLTGQQDVDDTDD